MLDKIVAVINSLPQKDKSNALRAFSESRASLKIAANNKMNSAIDEQFNAALENLKKDAALEQVQAIRTKPLLSIYEQAREQNMMAVEHVANDCIGCIKSALLPNGEKYVPSGVAKGVASEPIFVPQAIFVATQDESIGVKLEERTPIFTELEIATMVSNKDKEGVFSAAKALDIVVHKSASIYIIAQMIQEKIKQK